LFETRPSQIFLRQDQHLQFWLQDETETFQDPDRDVFRDVTNGTACYAFGFKLLQIMLCFVHLLHKTQFSISNNRNFRAIFPKTVSNLNAASSDKTVYWHNVNIIEKF